jgi:hypothetical protein
MSGGKKASMRPSAPELDRAPAGPRALAKDVFPARLDRPTALPRSLLATPNSWAPESFPCRRPVEGSFPPFVHRLPTGLPAHSVDRDGLVPWLPNSQRG